MGSLEDNCEYDVISEKDMMRSNTAYNNKLQEDYVDQIELYEYDEAKSVTQSPDNERQGYRATIPLSNLFVKVTKINGWKAFANCSNSALIAQ